MKIAVIGDLQFPRGEEGLVAEGLAHLRALKPDLAVAMGDYSVYGAADRGEMWRECAALLDASGMPHMPLLGNHDTEYDPGQRARVTVDQWYRGAFGRTEKDALISAGGVHCLCLSLAVQPEEGYATKNVCLLAPEQYAWADRALPGLGGAPVLLFVHAPTAGNGLRQVPAQHAAATDAYMEQNHAPERMRALLARHPEIVACVSAHFHMGHAYDSAISFSRDLLHISCGVMTSASRDGARHSRVLDVSDGHMDVFTVDHGRGGAVSLDFSYRGDLRDLLRQKERARGRFTVHAESRCLLGDDRPEACFLDDGRVYIATEKGFVWEFDRETQSLRGAIARKAGAVALYRDGDTLHCAPNGGELYAVGHSDPFRFDRLGEALPQTKRLAVPRGTRLLSIPFVCEADDAGGWVRF